MAKLGGLPILSPQLKIVREERLGADDLIGVQAVAATSAAAIDALSEDVAEGRMDASAVYALPIYCVGDATADRARAVGFKNVSSAAGDAEALASRLTVLSAEGGAVLHPRGVKIASGLERAGGPVVRTRIVYRAKQSERLSDEAIAALTGPAAALFHSRRIAESFSSALGRHAPRALFAIAISARAAVPLETLPFAGLRIASAPNERAMLDLLADWLSKHPA